MQKYIQRTMVYTKVSGFLIQLGGDYEKIELEPMTFFGKLDEVKARKCFRKVYGQDAIVTRIDHISELRRMSIERFLGESEKVEIEEE